DATFDIARVTVCAKVDVRTQRARLAAKARPNYWIHAAAMAAAPNVYGWVHERPCSSKPRRLVLYALGLSVRQPGTGSSKSKGQCSEGLRAPASGYRFAFDVTSNKLTAMLALSEASGSECTVRRGLVR